jgi:transposase
MEQPRHNIDANGVGNIVGIDPHKRTLSATVLDGRGGLLDQKHFRVSGDGHRALEEWADAFGAVGRWGVEGASGVGRHTALFLCERGHDVRDVSPARTNDRARGRRQGKSDSLDCERIARETLAHHDLPAAFKRVDDGSGPDETRELLSLWHKQRRSVVKLRQQLLNEAKALLTHLREDLREALPDTTDVRPRLAAVAERDRALSRDPATALRLRLLEDHTESVAQLDVRESEATRELAELVKASRSSLEDLVGIATRGAAELLVEVGDPRRFSEGGFARFNGTAPVPASSGEGDNEPVRHRLNRGGNRRVNSVLHVMAVT